MLNNTETTKLELTISGMDCADCALNLERGVGRLDGVDDCQVNFTAGKMRINGSADLENIEQRIRTLGYAIVTESDEDEGESRQQPPKNLLHYLWTRQDSRMAMMGSGVLLASGVFSLLRLSSLMVVGLHLLIIAIVGAPIMLSGLRELRYARKITINLLMAIAVVGALIIGETGEAATVIVLFAIGEALEGYAADKARYSLRALIDLAPQHALVKQPCIDCVEHFGREGYIGGPCPFCEAHDTQVGVDALQIDDVIIVHPGDRIPMDGAIIAGASSVDQAPITGESVPVDKTEGDTVFAGTINGAGALEVRVTSLAKDNTLSRIITLVEEAQSQRAPTQRFIDQFAQWYTPGVVVLAALIALVPPIVFGASFWNTVDGSGWLYRGLALLIIACPCALVISTPVTIVSGLTNAARQGILIKGGAPLEALAGVRTFAFDKTGTLTMGQPAITAVQCADCSNPGGNCDECDDLLALAAAVERRSEHPIAQAVVNYADARAVLHKYPAANAVTGLAGRGVQGSVDGHTVTIGSHAYFDTQFPHEPALCQQATLLEKQGQTTMLLAQDEKVSGLMTVADQPRSQSKATLAELQAMRPAINTVMLTGDNDGVASVIAQELGVSDVRAGLLPGDKLAAIQALEHAGPTAMIGDGVNDAPALAAATVGIAMGGAGTPQAMETADIVLMQDDIDRLPNLVRLSRRTLRVVRQNIGLAFGIKALVLLLAVGGWASLWLAVFADVGASLIVTANGMRILHD